ncbi:IS4 transposase [Bradyrhizobium japonicum]
MADQNGPAILSRQRLLGGIDVSDERGERIFHERDVVAFLRENIGNRLPARLVHESAVHEHDVVRCSLGQFGGLGGADQRRSGQEYGGG